MLPVPWAGLAATVSGVAPPPKLKLDATDCWPAKVGKLAAVPNGETADCGLEGVRENPPKAGAEIFVQLNICEHCAGRSQEIFE